MKEIIAIINQKGGVAKTTTAHALGAGLSARGYKVLWVDLDAQGNLSLVTGVTGMEVTVTGLLKQEATAADVIISTPQGDIIPADITLAGADLMLNTTGKEFRLKEALEPVLDEYDYIIIDTPPVLGILTVNALTVATSAVIPAQADDFSLNGIAQLFETVSTVRKYCNSGLSIKGILLTRFNKQTVLSRDMAEMLREAAGRIGTRVFESTIRECIALKEAQAVKQDIFTYSPKSNAALDYSNLVIELTGAA